MHTKLRRLAALAALLTTTALGATVVAQAGEAPDGPVLRQQPLHPSEAAVAAGLKWLAAHQQPDGSWSFRHGGAAGDYANPGTWPSTTGATGVTLLAFLGAGHTHEKGVYRQTVRQGLDYLVRQMKATRSGGDVRSESTAYVWQGLAAQAVCEAYAMTQDKTLLDSAQKTVDFIAASQDETSGGWLSKPGGKPDTVVTAWQIMALKSAHLTYLKVPEATVKRAARYLREAAVDEGMQYRRFGTEKPNTGQPDDTATAAALLCRGGYLGWQRDQWVPTPDASDPPWRGEKMLRPDSTLARGIGRLSQPGPAPHRVMRNYFTTLLLFGHGDERWQKWQQQVRDQLVKNQATDGDAAGSWFDSKDAQAPGGGRLWQTALALMALEVYYRHLPIYRAGQGAGRE